MNDATHDAVTPTVKRTLPAAANRGDVSMRDVLDAYMAAYMGRDSAMGQRLAYWVEAIGDVRLRDVDADLIADHIEQLTAQPVRKYVGKGCGGTPTVPRSSCARRRDRQSLPPGAVRGAHLGAPSTPDPEGMA